MNAKRDLWPQFLRWDWAVYWIVVGALLATFVMQIPEALAAGASGVSVGGQDATARSASGAGFDLGALYALLVWIVIPLVAFVLVNRSASRSFRRRIAAAEALASVPAVVAKNPTRRGASSRRRRNEEG